MAALPSSRHPERDRLVDGDDRGGLGDRLMVERERADEASLRQHSCSSQSRSKASADLTANGAAATVSQIAADGHCCFPG
jgi:hypothetical protein